MRYLRNFGLGFTVLIIICFGLFAIVGSNRGGDGGDSILDLPPPDLEEDSGTFAAPPPDGQFRGQFEFAGEVTYQKNWNDQFMMLGGLRNIGTDSVTWVNLTITVRDAEGNALGNGWGSLVADSYRIAGSSTQTNTGLRSGEVGYFLADTFVDADLVDRVDARVSFSFNELETPNGRLVVIDHRLDKDSFGDLIVYGTARNDGTVALENGRVFVVVMNHDNKVIDITHTNIAGMRLFDPDNNLDVANAMTPGQTAEFEIRTLSRFSETSSVLFKPDWEDLAAAN